MLGMKIHRTPMMYLYRNTTRATRGSNATFFFVFPCLYHNFSVTIEKQYTIPSLAVC